MKFLPKYGLIAAVVSSLFTVGCASKSINTRSETDILIDQQIESTYKNVKSLTGTVEMKSIKSKSATDGVNQKIIPSVLKSRLDVQWYGEAETVLTDLSDALGESVKFNTMGNKPSTPYDVYVNSVNREFINILEDIGFQLPANVLLNVVVDPFVKDQVKLELQYNEE